MLRLHGTNLVALLLVNACAQATTLQSSAPIAVSANANGVRYYVPRDVIVVDAKVVRSKERDWKVAAGKPLVANGACVVDDEKLKRLRTDYEIAFQTLPDDRWAYELGLSRGGSVEQTLALGVTASGLLTSMNYGSKGMQGEVVGNIAKGIAGIAGTVIGIGAMGANPLILTEIASGVASPIKTMLVRALDFAAPTSKFAIQLTNDEYCYQQADPTKATRSFERRFEAERALDEAQKERAELLRQSATAKTLDDVKRYRGLDSLQEIRNRMIQSWYDAAHADIMAGIARTRAKAGIKEEGVASPFKASIDVTTMPKEPASTPFTVAQARALAPTGSQARLLLDSAWILTTVEDTPRSLLAVPVPTETPKLACPRSDKGGSTCVIIRYRAPVSRIVRVYAASGDADTSKLTLRETRLVDLVSSSDPVLAVALAGKSAGDGSMGLTFGRHGTVTGLDQKATSTAAASSRAFADAISGSREAFQSGLTGVQTAQTSMVAIQQAARTARIKEIQDQQALLDAQISLEGTSASKDLSLQKKQLDAELALLNSQQTLATAQNSTATTAELLSMRQEIAKIGVQLELLRQQMELEKTKRALEEQRKP